MAPQKVHVSGFVALENKLKELESKGTVFVLFSGSKDQSGNSWCPDCVTADPIVTKCAESLEEGAFLVHCDVGPRPFWKDQNNAFRTDERFKLTGVPTLLKWKSNKRLVESQLFDKGLVDMLFEE